MQTTNPKNLGAVAVTQRTPANHTSNHTKIHKDYKTDFDRAYLPNPSNYYAEQDLKLTGSGEWKNALCPFHKDSKPSRSRNTTPDLSHKFTESANSKISGVCYD